MNVRGWALIVVAALATEGAVRAFAIGDAIPPPSLVVVALAEELASGRLSGEVAVTLEAVLGGFVVAAFVAVPLGLLLGTYRWLRDATEIVVELLRPMPSVALIPLAVLVFGLGLAMRRSVVAYVALWPILIHTLYGVRHADLALVDVARTYGVRSLRRLLTVTLPASLPAVFTGLRVGLSIALLAGVTVELVAANDGIGGYLMDRQVAAQLPEMYAAIVVTGVVGYVANRLLVRAERRVVFWSAEARLAIR